MRFQTATWHLTQRLAGNVGNRVLQVMLTQKRTVEAVTNDGDDGAPNRVKGMSRAQRVAAQSLLACPLDAFPLQEIVRFAMQKFAEGVIRGRLEQPSGTKAERVDGNYFPGYFCEKKAAVVGQELSGLEKCSNVSAAGNSCTISYFIL